MTESDLRAVLVKKLRLAQPTWVVFRHEDHYTTGVPDISVTGNGRTSWLETKLVKDSTHPKEKELKLQRMLELDHHSFARYIVYAIRGTSKFAVILTPAEFQKWPNYTAEFWIPSHVHGLIARYIIGKHLS